ncbi:DUF4331 family protein [Spirosoma luteum]|uniref:T9SS type A sorting domain-containing protein n=1 Tax=Spirosoma luteum TaxID=431553 RepID=UPI003CCC39AD
MGAAVLGLTNPTYANINMQFIPNMDGFPNGRRLEDDVTTIELQAVGGVVLAAIGLWYDDYDPKTSPSPVTPMLGGVLGFNAGVTKNDTTLKAAFPFVQDPWRGFIGNQYMGPDQPVAAKPLAATVVGFNCSTGAITFGRVGGDANRTVEYQAAGVTLFTTNVNQKIEAELLRDVSSRRILVVQARYVGDPASMVTYNFDFRTPCGQARVAAENVAPLSMRLLGNPTTNSDVTFEVNGAVGQTLKLGVTNSRGQFINQKTISEAGTVERHTLPLGEQPGTYFLQASTPTGSQTIKVIRH